MNWGRAYHLIMFSSCFVLILRRATVNFMCGMFLFLCISVRLRVEMESEIYFLQFFTSCHSYFLSRITLNWISDSWWFGMFGCLPVMNFFVLPTQGTFPRVTVPCSNRVPVSRWTEAFWLPHVCIPVHELDQDLLKTVPISRRQTEHLCSQAMEQLRRMVIELEVNTQTS